MEIQGVDPDIVPPFERKKQFQSFMEDYNTVTLPHKKYYDLPGWEFKQAKKQQKKLAKQHKRAATRGLDMDVSAVDAGVSLFNDEEKLRQQRKLERQKKLDEEFKQRIVETALNAAQRERDSMKKILEGTVQQLQNHERVQQQ